VYLHLSSVKPLFKRDMKGRQDPPRDHCPSIQARPFSSVQKRASPPKSSKGRRRDDGKHLLAQKKDQSFPFVRAGTRAMKPPPSPEVYPLTFRRPKYCLFLYLMKFYFFFAALALPFVARAAPTTGDVVGHVYNPSTGEFVRNAEVRLVGANLLAITEVGGAFRLAGVPAGDVTVSVSYSGYRTATATLHVDAGQTTTHEFELSSSLAPVAEEQVVRLNEYIVSTEREGNAKAIMDQRAAMNIKNIVASDTFGDVAEGNIGEFLKFMPGINLEYAESDTRTVHIRGLPAKYATVTFDGNRMSNAGSSSLATGRTFEFEQVSINSVDTIEVNKTISADMDGDAVAGTINLKSKSAFNRKERYLGWQANVVANSYAFSLNRDPGPGDARHRKILPGGIIEYSDTFLGGKLGISATLSESNMFNEQFRVQNTYDNVPTATRPSAVVPVTIRIKDGPKFTERTAASLNLDYKLSAHTIISLRSQFNYYDAEFHNRQLLINSTRALLDPASNATTMLQSTSTSSNTVRWVLGGNSQRKFGNTGSISPAIEYKRDNLSLDGTLPFFTVDQSLRRSRSRLLP
jgi:iron complex outermembrane receptor protein